MRRLPTTTSAIINFVVWDADHGQTSQQWSCEWMLSCSKTFYAALFIVFDHVVVLRHHHSVNENRARRTFSRLKGFLWVYDGFNDWDQFVVSFLDHRQLYSAAGRWMNVAVTHHVAVFSCSWHVDETDRGCQQERQQSWISLFETPYMDKYRNTNRVGGCFTVRNVLYIPIYRSRLRCCPRSSPIRQWEQNINTIDNITR